MRFFVGWVHPRKNHALDLAHFQSTARGSELLGPTSRRARATDASRLGGPVLKTVMTRAGEPLLGAAAGGTTTYVGDLIKGEETTWGDLAWGSGVGAVMPMIPGGPTNMASLQQMARFNPTSLATSFSTMQGGRLWQSTMTGAGAGVVLDAGKTGVENAMAAFN